MTPIRSHSPLLLPLSLSLSLFALGCGAAEERPDGPGGYGDDLDGARDKNQKSDVVSECGDDTCEVSLCGYDCSEPGALCDRACAESDRRAEAFVELAASGDHAVERDSRDVEYDPILSLQNALFYGCELWDFTGSDKQGLELKYAEIFDGAFTPGEPRDHGYEFFVYAKPFSGPGTYPAEGFLSSSSAARDAGDFYFDKAGCTLEVGADGDGLAGTFSCPALPNKQNPSRTVALSGSFGCGANALDINIIRLPEPG